MLTATGKWAHGKAGESVNRRFEAPTEDLIG